MKKILTHLTGIVFLITILAAAGCGSGEKPSGSTTEESDEATFSLIFIKCEAIDINGELQFKMWDRNNDTIVATISSEDPLKLVDTLTTEVQPRALVLWLWGKDSEVTDFVNVAPQQKYGILIPEAADPEDEGRVFIHRIPKDAEPGTVESYYIEFIWKGDTVTIDPYLKVPDQ